MWRKLLQLAHIFSVPSSFQIGHDVPGAGRGRLSCRVLLLVVVSLGLIKFSALHLLLQLLLLLLLSFSSLFLKKFALFVAHQKFMVVTCCQVTKIYGYLIKFNERSEAKEVKVQQKGHKEQGSPNSLEVSLGIYQSAINEWLGHLLLINA